ncbi:unnamed protein product [Sphagnum troendelagicum]|uniref:Uncharacterized protein n=1 Tax=Sphagnum troendelagicum TaxID=128251 RepID=A0ABP0UKR0_9BRYO
MAMAGLAASSPCVYSPSCSTSPSFNLLCFRSSSPSSSSPSATSSSSSSSSLSFGFPFVGLKRSAIRGVQRHEALHPTLESFGSCGARTGRRRTRRGVGVVMPIRAGLPVVSSIPIVGPLANFVLNPILLFVLYAAGAVRFWSGFTRTTYNSSASTKLGMTALWPVLFLASKTYRSNFKKAIQ